MGSGRTQQRSVSAHPWIQWLVSTLCRVAPTNVRNQQAGNGAFYPNPSPPREPKLRQAASCRGTLCPDLGSTELQEGVQGVVTTARCRGCNLRGWFLAQSPQWARSCSQCTCPGTAGSVRSWSTSLYFHPGRCERSSSLPSHKPARCRSAVSREI